MWIELVCIKRYQKFYPLPLCEIGLNKLHTNTNQFLGIQGQREKARPNVIHYTLNMKERKNTVIPVALQNNDFLRIK